VIIIVQLKVESFIGLCVCLAFLALPENYRCDLIQTTDFAAFLNKLFVFLLLLFKLVDSFFKSFYLLLCSGSLGGLVLIKFPPNALVIHRHQPS
jgi:hypothetical protein